MIKARNTSQLKQSEERVQQYKRRVKTEETKKYSFVQQKQKLVKLSNQIEQQVTERFHRMSTLLDDRAKIKSNQSTKVKLPPLQRRYYKSKPTQLTEKEKLMQKIQKRLEYGQKASNNYNTKRNQKAEQSKYDQNIQKFNLKEHQKYKRILENLKKRHITFIQKPYIQQAKIQIHKIKKSRNSMSQKFHQLNKLYHSYEQKDRYGMQQALQLQTQANLALADLYLSQQIEY